ADTNRVADVGGTLFLDYLSHLGYSNQQIIDAGGANLATTYASLTGQAAGQAYPSFLAWLKGR
ncbi:MAG: hypothetical protein ACYCW6_28055, partial [Candidatus Xenobia bacterium]